MKRIVVVAALAALTVIAACGGTQSGPNVQVVPVTITPEQAAQKEQKLCNDRGWTQFVEAQAQQPAQCTVSIDGKEWQVWFNAQGELFLWSCGDNAVLTKWANDWKQKHPGAVAGPSANDEQAAYCMDARNGESVAEAEKHCNNTDSETIPDDQKWFPNYEVTTFRNIYGLSKFKWQPELFICTPIAP